LITLISKNAEAENPGIMFLINMEKRGLGWGTDKERKEIPVVVHGRSAKQYLM